MIFTDFRYDDGGREAAGYRGAHRRDCAVRAIAIATERDYQEIHDMVIDYAKHERPRGKTKRSHPRTGVRRRTLCRIMDDLGWVWVPTMLVGSGCQVHLRADQLPPGRLVVSVSKHIVAVIDGVVHDTDDGVDRNGTRCVYGYWHTPDNLWPVFLASCT
jgi:hypothetical protein